MNARFLLVAIPAAAAAATIVITAPSCSAGDGVAFTAIEEPLGAGCGSCHSASTIDELVTRVRDMDDALFTPENFPDGNFNSALVATTVDALIANASPAADATLDATTPPRKAWMLHELHELAEILKEDVPPDFTSESSFDTFSRFKNGTYYEGCEVIDKLDKATAGDPEGMPPPWAKKLFELLGQSFVAPTAAEKRQIKSYIELLAPALRNCVPAEGSYG